MSLPLISACLPFVAYLMWLIVGSNLQLLLLKFWKVTGVRWYERVQRSEFRHFTVCLMICFGDIRLRLQASSSAVTMLRAIGCHQRPFVLHSDCKLLVHNAMYVSVLTTVCTISDLDLIYCPSRRCQYTNRVSAAPQIDRLNLAQSHCVLCIWSLMALQSEISPDRRCNPVRARKPATCAETGYDHCWTLVLFHSLLNNTCLILIIWLTYIPISSVLW